MKEELKLFHFHECDWIVANNRREAVKFYADLTGMSKLEALEYCDEVPRERWDALTFFYDWEADRQKKCTFTERIQEVILNNEDAPPFFLATSEF